jgi:hypothetical protein
MELVHSLVAYKISSLTLSVFVVVFVLFVWYIFYVAVTGSAIVPEGTLFSAASNCTCVRPG